MNSMEMRADHRQNQTLSPRLQHAVRLLQMSSLDFAALVRDSLGKNPFLEAEEGDGEDGDGSIEASSDHEAPQGTLDSDERAAAPESDDRGDTSYDTNYDDSANDRDLWQADSGSGLRRAEDGEMSALEMMPVETSLNTHLHGQLSLMRLPERDLVLARTIVESLDDDGYLRTPLDELMTLPDLVPRPTLQEMQLALRCVQTLEPAGVGRTHGVGMSAAAAARDRLPRDAVARAAHRHRSPAGAGQPRCRRR